MKLINTAALPADDAAPRPDGVNYIATGDADSERTVVLLHGFCDNLTTWDRVVAPLAVGSRVIAIDLPGFGLSTRSWLPALLDGYVDVVREVLDAEGVTGAVSVIGTSLGAAVAALYAARYPHGTERIVLIDMPGLRGVSRVWRLAISRPAELGLRTALRVIGHTPARIGLCWAYSHLAARDTRRLDPSVRQSFSTPYAANGSIPALLPLGRALVRDLDELRLGSLVDDLGVPVLLIVGSRELIPVRVRRRSSRDRER